MIPIKEYLGLRQNSPRTACDVLLRQLPEAIARWRSEQPLPQGRLKEEYIKVDSETGYVEIEPMDAADAAATVGECDDVKDYGAIVANLLETSMPHAARRVALFADACCRGEYATIGDVMLAVERRKSGGIYWWLVAIIAVLLVLLVFLNR